MEPLAVRVESEEMIFRYAVGIHEPREKEFHTQHELFFLMGGRVVFISDAGRRMIEPNTAVLIPEGTFHQFLFEGDEETYRRCVFKLGAVPWLERLIRQRFSTLVFLQDEALTDLFEKLRREVLSQRSQQDKTMAVEAYLALILLALDKTPGARTETVRLSPITQSTLEYIRRELAGDLSIGTLAQRLHISASHLSHVFKGDMHISVQKYVRNKRLIQANQMLREGIPAIQTAMKCGFRDYSNFCQQYKKAFGYPPARTGTQ